MSNSEINIWRIHWVQVMGLIGKEGVYTCFGVKNIPQQENLPQEAYHPRFNLSKHILSQGVPHSWLGVLHHRVPPSGMGIPPVWVPPSGTELPPGKGPGTTHLGTPGKDIGHGSIMGWRLLPARKDMGPVEVLWDGDGVPSPQQDGGQTENITSHHTTYVGGKITNIHYNLIQITFKRIHLLQLKCKVYYPVKAVCEIPDIWLRLCSITVN